MKKVSLRDKLKYEFDNIMSRGIASLISWLAIVTVALIVIVSFIVWATDSAPEIGFPKLLWISLMRTLDPGTLAGDEGSIVFIGALFLITLTGIFILSMLIGLLTTGIENKLDLLRKGRSIVVEKNHTIILGWSDRVFTIIPELVAANSNLKKSCIVIMGDKDKVEMEDEIRDNIKDTGNTRIVCRQGSPVDINDLEIVNLDTCKSIIIIDNLDSNVIKTILAIVSHPKERQEPYNIVATIKDSKNYEVAKMASRGQAEIVLANDLISRIIAQTCRQPGLSSVYTELLDFGGDEIYFSSNPSLTGKTFAQAMMMYDDSIIMGLYSNGVSKLNPPMDTIIGEGDEIVAISEDDDTILISELKDYNVNELAITTCETPEESSEHTLILGWNEHASVIINEMDNYVVPGSSVTVVADYADGEQELKKYCSGVIKNQNINFIYGDTKDRRILDELTQNRYNHIIILCYTHLDIQEADAITLITLLHLRDISEKTGMHFSIVSQMMDIKNRSLAEIAKVNDFIVSDKLISLLITQISENKQLNSVFQDIFDSDGSEIYIKPAGRYIKPGEKVNFYSVVKAASLQNEVVIGYKLASEINNAEKSYGIYVNPKKSVEITFSENDGIIVLAEE